MSTNDPRELDANSIASLRLTAIFLRGHLKLQAAGLRASRTSRTQLAAIASLITGEHFTSRTLDKALPAVEKFLEETKNETL